MPKVMLINVTHAEESRVAILNDHVLEAFEIESLSREHLKGNIYKGVVHRTHPALEAAFVDIGAERDAFLPLDEICFRNLPRPESGNGQGEAAENGRRRRRIRDLLHPGEEILVQITKEQFANKPPTLTTFYSLPGRYLVLLPGSDETGISRRIEGEDRIRLRKLVADLQPPEGFGVIVRTAANLDQDTAELSRDFHYLQRLWENVQQVARSKRAPALVYREHDIVLRTIRDFYTPDVDEIYIDNEEVYQRARDFLRDVMPGKERVLHLYQGEQPIFSAFDVESQFESIFKRRVPLRSGGSIVIDTAEALTAVDVNSGGSVRGHNPEETAFRTNQEAAAEIARQLRLRDIGGLIVIDFIDMRDSGHIHEIERAMREALREDRARHEVGRISRFGLMEISRQRLRPAAMATTYTSCPMCEGHGAVRTTESAALVALRKIHNRVALGDVASVRVSLPSGVAMYLLNQKRDELARLEQRYQTRIQVNLSEQLMPHQVEIEVRERRPAEKGPAPVPPGTVAPMEAGAPAETTSGEEAASSEPAAKDSGKKRRRRRARRRGTGKRAAAAIAEALAALGSATGLGEEGAGPPSEALAPADAQPEPAAPGSETPTAPSSGHRRRRRRGGSRRAKTRALPPAGAPPPADFAGPGEHGPVSAPPAEQEQPRLEEGGEPEAQAKAKRTRRSTPAAATGRRRATQGTAEPAAREAARDGADTLGPPDAKPRGRRRQTAPHEAGDSPPADTAPESGEPRAKKSRGRGGGRRKRSESPTPQ